MFDIVYSKCACIRSGHFYCDREGVTVTAHAQSICVWVHVLMILIVVVAVWS